MKEYRLRIEDDLFKEIKHYAVEFNKTINEVIIDIINEWIHIQELEEEDT